MKIKKGDTVLITTGKNRSKTGKVERAIPFLGKVVISGINVRKKHLKPSRKYPKGGVLEFPAPIDTSNVKLICPKCGKPTRVGFEKVRGKKERMCKKCKEIINA